MMRVELDAIEPLQIRRRHVQPALVDKTNLSAREMPFSHVRDAKPTSAEIEHSTSGGRSQNTRARRGVRPLPPIPQQPRSVAAAPPSLPCSAESSPRSVRPLPTPPCIYLSESSTASSSSLPSTPSSTQSHDDSIQSHSYAEEEPTPKRPTLPRLVMPMSASPSPEGSSLKPPEREDSSSLCLSPSVSPLSPQPLTPSTVKRKRLSKLRRHLGERVPDETVYGRPVLSKKEEVLEQLRAFGEDGVYLSAAMTVAKILALESDEDCSDSGCSAGGSEELDDEREWMVCAEKVDEDYSWVLSNGLTYRAVSARQHDRKWVWEKNGRRWDEPDYDTVIQKLRTL